MIKLGPISLDHPFILAPMAGITNSPFRRLMRKQGSSAVISELVSANGLEYGGNRTLELLKFHEDERPVGLQLFGEDAAILAKAAKKVEELGADFVDLNLGCPVNKVVSKGAGSAMCKNLPELSRVLRAMVEAVKIPVTIKIRTGWDSQSRNAVEVVKVAEDAGVAWVAIHGRTRAQGYSGEADWDFIGDVKAKVRLPIIGNGDITTAEKAMDRLKTYGVDAVLIGRGALRNPFLFKQSAALWRGESPIVPVASDLIDLLLEQKGLLESHFIDKVALLHGRKFLAWYASGFPGCHEFRKRVFEVQDSVALWKMAVEFFERSLDSREGRDLKFMSEPFLMGGHG